MEIPNLKKTGKYRDQTSHRRTAAITRAALRPGHEKARAAHFGETKPKGLANEANAMLPVLRLDRARAEARRRRA
jgi:hypothetical protein